MSISKNTRSLDIIANDINKLARRNIFDVGDLLLEAKAQCEHGKWLGWLDSEFDWSVDTAQRYMRVADLGTKFRTLRNLKLAATTLYDLADHEKEEEVSGIVDELAKHATKKRLSPRDAERVIKVGIGRHRWGDRPDATLVELVDLEECFSGSPWYQKAAAALQDRNPETSEEALSIIDLIEGAHWDAELLETEEEAEDRYEAEDEAEREAEELLDGPGPELGPSITPPEPQRLETSTGWAEQRVFANAVRGLLALRTKPLARFVGTFSPSELEEAVDFLMAVAASDKPAIESATVERDNEPVGR